MPISEPLPQGCGVALVTPFDATGALDDAALVRLVEHVLAGGCDFIVVLGTTGEAVSQTRKQCIDLLRRVHQLVAGRVPLVAGPFGANATFSLLERLRDYEDVLRLPGYVAIMSSVPSYVKPNQEGIFRHFMALAEASPLPILLYNVPGRTGIHMTSATTLRLAAASELFVGVKEASGSIEEGLLLLRDRPQGFRVFSGDDPTAMALTACGADGSISVVANAYPEVFAKSIQLTLAGKLKEARRLNSLLLELHPLLYIDGNPSGVKAVLHQLGLCGDTVRLPLAKVRAATRKLLDGQVLKLAGEMAPGLV